MDLDEAVELVRQGSEVLGKTPEQLIEEIMTRGWPMEKTAYALGYIKGFNEGTDNAFEAED